MPRRIARRVSRLRRIFRWCRIFVWLVILAVLIAGIYLNTIGLPAFLKRPLLARLRAEGVQLDFERMRLRWYRGIVVDHATFKFLKHPLQPKFFSQETELNTDWSSLRDSSWRLKSLAVKEGRLIWPLSKTNSGALSLNEINAQVHFGPDQEMAIHQFTANFGGTKISVSGAMSHALALRDWKIFQAKKPPQGKNRLQEFADVLDKIHFSGSPEMSLQFTGDAAAPETFAGKFSFTAASAKMPWGSGTNLELTAEWRDLFEISGKNILRWKADSAETPWGGASNFHGIAKLSPLSTNTWQADLNVYAKQIQAGSVRAGSIHLAARTPLSFTHLIPNQLSGKIDATGAETKLGKAASAEITFSATTNSAAKMADESWAAWRKAEPFAVTWKGRFSNIKSPKLQMEKFACAGTWRAPDLQITNLTAELYDGKIAASAQLNVATREVRAKVSSDLDVQKIAALFPLSGQSVLANFVWEKPPELNGEFRAILPAWTNRSTHWQQEILPTLELSGQVSIERSAYRDVAVTSAKTDFAYSNRVWTLPHLRVNRPEGGVDLNLMANDQTHEFSARIHSQMDPKAIRHWLAQKEQAVLDDFRFTAPPEIRAALHGNWNEINKISAEGEIAANHFSFRSNVVDKLNCGLQFTNQNLIVSELRLDQADKFITAKKVALDFSTMKVYFTEVYSTVNPYPVIQLLGHQVVANMAPYQFAVAPVVRLNGSLLVTNVDDADLHFLVEGNQFHWKNLFTDKISGQVDWVGLTLVVTNVHATAYHNGTIAGAAFFDFTPPQGTDFHFDFAASDIDLHSFISGITGKTNQLEGSLYGQLVFDSANTHDSKSWRGHGRVNLRDGLLWDVPIFGIFSPLLNALLPGAGSSRAREATAEYLIRDGLIYSNDLEIRSATLRLDYRGGVDFDQNVDARVEAELLRDAWVIGPVVSLILTPLAKIFEYKVTGTLSNPKSEPVYIPNILMKTLRPFHTLKEALAPDKPQIQPVENPPIAVEP